MIRCLRCDDVLELQGRKTLQQANQWKALGSVGEFFVGEFEVDVFSCPFCGHVEFYNPFVGKEQRADNPTTQT